MNIDQVGIMRNLLENLWSALLPVVQDATAASPSSAYTTFFKDPNNRPFVAALLNNVTLGASVLPPATPPPAWQPWTPNGNPVFYAISARGQFSALVNDVQTDMLDFCNDNVFHTAAYPSTNPPIPFIIICPFFWTAQAPNVYGDLPPSAVNGQPASNCLSVNTAINRFRYNGRRPDGNPLGFSLTQYRMWILLEEIVHHYTYVLQGQTLDQYDINKCFRLSAQSSLMTAHTYVYYAASKLVSTSPTPRLCRYTVVLLIWTGIFANCKSFPLDKRQGTELLEVDSDDPSDEGDDTPLALSGAFNATNIEVPVFNATLSSQ